jgi:hypothetical protein
MNAQGLRQLCIIFVIISLLLCTVPLFSDDADNKPVKEEQNLSKALQIPTIAAPVEHRSSPFLDKAKRLAIVGIGTIPFAIFYTDFVFDAVRYVSNGFDVQYAPWPFKNQYSAIVNTNERFMRLGASIGASLIVGFTSVLIPYR